MRRILVFAERCWTSPRAGATEHYLQRVLAALAGEGHYTAVVTRQEPPWRPRKPPAIEIVDGVQVARIGLGATQPWVARVLLTRMHQQGKASAYDAVLDALPGAPVARRLGEDLPVIPFVFERAPRQALALPEGPVLTGTHVATEVLQAAGVPGNLLVHAPFASDTVEAGSVVKDDGVCIVRRPGRRHNAWSRMVARAARPARTREVLVQPGTTPAVDAVGSGGGLGVCLPGAEFAAYDLAALGQLPLLPDTPWGRALAEELGLPLLHWPWRAGPLAHALRRWTNDDAGRAAAREAAQANLATRDWSSTAGMVLATVENNADSR
jgi:hypothetical protein